MPVKSGMDLWNMFSSVLGERLDTWGRASPEHPKPLKHTSTHLYELIYMQSYSWWCICAQSVTFTRLKDFFHMFIPSKLAHTLAFHSWHFLYLTQRTCKLLTLTVSSRTVFSMALMDAQIVSDKILPVIQVSLIFHFDPLSSLLGLTSETDFRSRKLPPCF